MPTNPKVTKAFRAMRDLGISEEKVKPVLKNLLKLYDKNWELIEEENYRVLADTIFDTEEVAEAEERLKKSKNAEREKKALEDSAQDHDEPERPLKRLRLRHQEGQDAPSHNNSSPNVDGTSLKRPKVEQYEIPESRPQHQLRNITDSAQLNIGNMRIESQPVSTQPLIRNKGKQPVSPTSLVVRERSDTSQIGDADRTRPPVMKKIGPNPISHARCLKDGGKEPLLPGSASWEKRQKMHNTHVLIKPKEEPVTEDVLPQFEVPIAVIHPGDSTFENGLLIEQHGQELLANGKDKTDGVPALTNETKSNRVLAKIPDEYSDNLEIASLPFGDIKISLNCNSAVGRPDFRMPDLDAVLKLMEDKCLRSYKVVDPNFSLTQLMKKMCECVWELGIDATNESQEPMIESTPNDLITKSGATDALGDRGIASYLLNGSANVECVANMALPEIPRFPPCNNSQESVIETTPNDLITKSGSAEALGDRGMPSCSSNGSANAHCVANMPLTEVFGLPPPCNDVDGLTQPDKSIIRKDCVSEREKEQNGREHTHCRSLVVFQRRQLTPDTRALHDVNDIAKGQEQYSISLVNEINSECPPSFHYIPQNVVFQNAFVNFSLARIGKDNSCSTCFGDCLLSSKLCSCAHEMGGDFVYTLEGLVKEEFLDECVSMNRDPQKQNLYYCKECPLERSKNEDILEPCKGHLVRKFIKECWWKCGCSKQCGNRVVQRGINCNLQVFRTSDEKGWGLRTLEDLPKGAFVCEYVGEVLTNVELFDRISRSPNNEELAYPVLLDADWISEGFLKDEKALCLDATYYGNVARFINHRCFDSNLVEIPVKVETPDHHYYHLAFFTTRKIEALEELTWDYGVDFDDHDHPVKAFRCLCGSKFCRNIKRSSRSRSIIC